ncbi:hypothetical protein [Bizionia sp. M204]|uniref:hypothetical protein n=1 Tax=Bizionia sp. M204 TaxID=2675331 RepID=UPI00206AD68E|nr:hypothetical protein [Bizionia sp. M204]UPS92512.1 hypothetical protein GMA17_12595 [Bizionia sp. M204]
MKFVFLVLFGLYFQSFYSQNDTLNLILENPIYGNRYDSGDIGVGFAIQSKDKRFLTDYYNFNIINLKGIDSLGNVAYYSLKDIRKEISIDSINYISISDLTKDKKFWQVHNELSLKKKIFLIEKRKGKFNSSTGKYEITYYMLPMIYEGTRKNVVPTDLSN